MCPESFRDLFKKASQMKRDAHSQFQYVLARARELPDFPQWAEGAAAIALREEFDRYRHAQMRSIKDQYRESEKFRKETIPNPKISAKGKEAVAEAHDTLFLIIYNGIYLRDMPLNEVPEHMRILSNQIEGHRKKFGILEGIQKLGLSASGKTVGEAVSGKTLCRIAREVGFID